MSVLFRHEGAAIDFVPADDVPAGAVVVQGDLLGVARLDIQAGQLGALAVQGVFEFPKATGAGSAISAGVKLFWDATSGIATADDAEGAHQLIGKSVAVAADEDNRVLTRLSQ